MTSRQLVSVVCSDCFPGQTWTMPLGEIMKYSFPFSWRCHEIVLPCSSSLFVGCQNKSFACSCFSFLMCLVFYLRPPRCPFPLILCWLSLCCGRKSNLFYSWSLYYTKVWECLFPSASHLNKHLPACFSSCCHQSAKILTVMNRNENTSFYMR